MIFKNPCYKCSNFENKHKRQCCNMKIYRGNVASLEPFVTNLFLFGFCSGRYICPITTQNNTTRQGWLFLDLVYIYYSTAGFNVNIFFLFFLPLFVLHFPSILFLSFFSNIFRFQAFFFSTSVIYLTNIKFIYYNLYQII